LTYEYWNHIAHHFGHNAYRRIAGVAL